MIKYENENYLTTEEAARYLGKTSTAFRQFYYRSKLPRRKLGGRLFFAAKDLEQLYVNDRFASFQTSGLTREQVYDLNQLLEIFLTSRQYIYNWVSRNGIKRYKDRTGKTLYNRAQIDAILNGVVNAGEDVDDI